jgi:hypothetical protein
MRRSGGVLAQHLSFDEVQPGVPVLLLAKNPPEILVDRSVVINDEYPVAGWGG